MSNVTTIFREGARSQDPYDVCPQCKKTAPMFVWHFKKFGQHQLVACDACLNVTVDGGEATPISVAGANPPHA